MCVCCDNDVVGEGETELESVCNQGNMCGWKAWKCMNVHVPEQALHRYIYIIIMVLCLRHCLKE